MTPKLLGITERTIIPPYNGWVSKTYYLVDVALDANNVIHKSIFYSGYCVNDVPSGYNKLFNPTYDRNLTIDDVYYLKVLKGIKDLQQIHEY